MNKGDLAEQVLKEVPEQICTYMEKNGISPNHQDQGVVRQDPTIQSTAQAQNIEESKGGPEPGSDSPPWESYYVHERGIPTSEPALALASLDLIQGENSEKGLEALRHYYRKYLRRGGNHDELYNELLQTINGTEMEKDDLDGLFTDDETNFTLKFTSANKQSSENFFVLLNQRLNWVKMQGQ